MSGFSFSREKVEQSGLKVALSYAGLPAPSTPCPTASGAFREPQLASSTTFRVPQSIVVVLGLKIPPKARQSTVVTQARSPTSAQPASSTPPKAHHPAPDVAISTALLRELLPHPPMPSLKVLPAERQERPSQLDRVL